MSLDEESRSENRTHLRSLQSHTTVVGVSAFEVLQEKVSFLYLSLTVGLNIDLGPSSSLSKPLE